MNDDTTPRPARRRPHPAARARNATLALSIGAFGAITGGMAAHAATTAHTATTAQTASSTTAATQVATEDDSTASSDDSTAAVPASNLSSGTAATSSHGS